MVRYVIGFQDSQEWEGIIGFDSTYSEDEGWSASLPIGELNGEIAVVTSMLADGMDLNVVIKYTKLLRIRLENIQRRISGKKSLIFRSKIRFNFREYDHKLKFLSELR